MSSSGTQMEVKEDKGSESVSRPLSSLQRAVNRMFDDFGNGFFRTPFRSTGTGVDDEGAFVPLPAADISETDDSYVISIELPGMTDEQIEVKQSNRVLTVSAEKKDEKEEKKKDFYLSERRFGSFSRSFQLPDGVDASSIAADFRSGVLTITLPKTAEAKQSERTIKVRSG